MTELFKEVRRQLVALYGLEHYYTKKYSGEEGGYIGSITHMDGGSAGEQGGGSGVIVAGHWPWLWYACLLRLQSWTHLSNHA
jgi:hypothetical protein